MNIDILIKIRSELKKQVDIKTEGNIQSFFKETITHYGVKTALVARIARRYFKEAQLLGKDNVYILCEELLRSDYIEEAFIAFDWTYQYRENFTIDDFNLFEKWIGMYINNWAKCDTFCNHTIGSFLEKYPIYIEHLNKWAKSENRWYRRAAAVSLIIPAKKGKFLDEIFKISDILLEDKDDLVQKGYGWLLKEASFNYRGEVFDYVMRNNEAMPRTALRYSIERMPDIMRYQAMGRRLGKS